MYKIYPITAWCAALLAAVLTLAAPSARAADTLVSTGAVWKYLDNGSNQGTNWQRIEFDDRTWTNGPAQLGFGDSDERTTINGGPSTNRFLTIYFWRPFVLTDASLYTNLIVRLLRDDGGVVYLNGTEVFRSNMTNSGPITYTNLALSS